MAKQSGKKQAAPKAINWGTAICEETHGMVGDRYLRCGKPAVMQIQHRGRAEGPYTMCLEHGTHNARNRDAEILQTKPGGQEPEVLPPANQDEQLVATDGSAIANFVRGLRAFFSVSGPF